MNEKQRRRAGRIRDWWQSANPTLMAGSALLAAGFALALLTLAQGPASDATSVLSSGLTSVIRVAQNVIPIFGKATQIPINPIAIAVIFAEVAPVRGKSVKALAAVAVEFFQELLSPAGLLTLVLLAAGYVALVRLLEGRLPGT